MRHQPNCILGYEILISLTVCLPIYYFNLFLIMIFLYVTYVTSVIIWLTPPPPCYQMPPCRVITAYLNSPLTLSYLAPRVSIWHYPKVGADPE